ncbi:MAG: type IV toxin-antitoxin system AbiEi family antitoxin domain-containing protein [Planctomycetes bacterium]|nr:type IV toxin-antitoxin system AbiEi family antitoxin domain-containing protein [Planctomycetota bacterium]
MVKRNPVHTRAGVELVRRLTTEGDRIFTISRARELAPAVGLSESYLRQALHHLAASGWLIRLRKGLYALSSPVPGVPSAHEFEVAMALVHPAAISHWSALHRHGLTDQAPRRVFVLTTTESCPPRVRNHTASPDGGGYLAGNTVYRFVQIKPERYFGTEMLWTGETRVTVTDPERTLVDGLWMPQYCGDFAEVLHALNRRGTALDVARIVDYALKLDAAVAKRLGWVLEQQGVQPSKLRRLAAVPIRGYRKLDPTGPRRGPCNRRWRVQENLPGKLAP